MDATKPYYCGRASVKRGTFIYHSNSAFYKSAAGLLMPVSGCKTPRKQVLLIGMRTGCIGIAFATLFLCLIFPSDLRAQAFQDLDFESATLVPIPGDEFSSVYFSDALPGWSGFSGTNQLSGALYDKSFLDSTGISIFDAQASFIPLTGQVIDGNYSVFLQAGAQLGSSTVGADASLSQSGLVPSGTKSLSFLAATNGPFEVSLGGIALNLISSPVPGESYSLFRADISSFAGQTDELDFTVFAQNPYNNSPRSLFLDDIQFSTQAIPEPGALSLVMMAVAGLGLWRLALRKTR